MKITTVAAFFAIAFSLGGCASGPKYTEASATIPSLPKNQGRVYIYRNSALGLAVRPNVYLSGEVVGEATAMGFFFVDKIPGSYDIATTTEVANRVTFTLEPGQTRYVRLSISMGLFAARITPELVDVETGKKEIVDTSYSGRGVAK